MKEEVIKNFLRITGDNMITLKRINKKIIHNVQYQYIKIRQHFQIFWHGRTNFYYYTSKNNGKGRRNPPIRIRSDLKPKGLCSKIEVDIGHGLNLKYSGRYRKSFHDYPSYMVEIVIPNWFDNVLSFFGLFTLYGVGVSKKSKVERTKKANKIKHVIGGVLVFIALNIAVNLTLFKSIILISGLALLYILLIIMFDFPVVGFK